MQKVTKLSREAIEYVKARREGMGIREAYKHAGFQVNRNASLIISQNKVA